MEKNKNKNKGRGTETKKNNSKENSVQTGSDSSKKSSNTLKAIYLFLFLFGLPYILIFLIAYLKFGISISSLFNLIIYEPSWLIPLIIAQVSALAIFHTRPEKLNIAKVCVAGFIISGMLASYLNLSKMVTEQEKLKYKLQNLNREVNNFLLFF